MFGWTLRRTAAACASATVAVSLLIAAPAAATTRATPGDFTGYAFDTCDAPSQRTMDRWLRHSKYWGAGIYIAGMNRACASQPHLTRGWVREQSRKGWRLLPLVVGRQASCSPKGYYLGKRISAKPADDYARARKQGRAAARSGVQAAQRLGIGRGSVLWFDLEHFDVGKTHCRRSALAFVSGWTRGLRARHYRSGLYSSASSGIWAVDNARRLAPGSYALPGYLWIAEWDGRAGVHSSYISRDHWWPHRRVKQYRGGHAERHGGARLVVDSNYLSTGRGTVAGRPTRPCDVRLDFRAYPRLTRGDRGDRVRAAQCLLRQHRHYRGRTDGRFDRHVARAVRRYQRDHPRLPVTGRLGARTWTALLSEGGRPLAKFGSGGAEVRRLQRALNAATKARLKVDGVFSAKDMRAVKHLQRRTGREPTGVVTAGTWRLLQRGRTTAPLPRLTRSDVHALLDGTRAALVVPFSSGAARP